MSQIHESDIEHFTISLLQSLGWDYIFGPDIAPDSENYHSLILNRKSC